MTTTTQKLLALADEYEKKAAALRLAAVELNGHATTRKQANGISTTLKKATQLRAVQTASSNGHGEPPPARSGETAWMRQKRERREKLTALLEILHDTGPLTVPEFRDAAKARGHKLTGLQVYTSAGYMARSRGGKYSFKKFPATVETAAAAAEA